MADDHTVFRENLKKVFSATEDIRIVGEAGDGVELLDLLRSARLNPHMVILDVTMPRLGGIETTKQIKMMYPEMKVLVLTIHKDRDYVRQAISAGAEGYLLKDQVGKELFSAIDRIRKGKVYISPLWRDCMDRR